MIENGEFATEKFFFSVSIFQDSLTNGFQVFWKSNNRDILHIVFIITFGLEKTSELFYWIRVYLSFKEISEFEFEFGCNF